MNIRFTFLILLSLIAFAFPAVAQTDAEAPTKMPLDPNIRTGVLPNGLTYFVKKNSEPEKRAELRLVVNAGSVLEDDDQQGLAHFVEHMAFNGSKNFEKSELVDYLESVGVKFGPHLNAYTSFDETVYMLQLPTDDARVLDKGLLVLQDWASGLSFDEKEIDKERGVVIEEWRLRTGADSRMMYEFMPVLVNGSHYADRLPIGKPDILKSFEYETLKRFYEKWYRPDLMAVIAVGDFDPEEMEAKIKARFSPIPVKKNAGERPYFQVPDHEDVKAVVSSDPEARFSMLMINFKNPIQKYLTEEDYRTLMVETLLSGMVTDRIEELKQKGESPIMFGGASNGAMFGLRTKAAFSTIALLNADGIEKGTKQVLTEVERVRRHGFIASELERQKTKVLSQIETRYNEREKTVSKALAGELVSYYLNGLAVPGVEWEFPFAEKILPTITLDEVNAKAKQLIRDKNAVLILTAQTKEGVEVPTKEALLATYHEVKASEVAPYEEFEDDRPLLPTAPVAGSVTSTKTHPGQGITEWQLSNGALVVLKPTDFKDDEIKYMAFSPGGLSRLSDGDFKKAWAASDIVASSGAGQFKQAILTKKLAGKVARVQPWIDDLREGLVGSCSPKDLETMLKLNYLYITAPRRDQASFNSLKQMLTGFAAMSNSPDAAFNDSLTVLMGQDHPRRQPMTQERIEELDLSTAYMFYLDRFMDVNDFTFTFVGNFDLKEIQPLIELYIGGLPSSGRKENWKDRGIKAPAGVVEKDFKLGADPKSMVSLVFTGKIDYTQEANYNLESMISVLSIMLRESLREEKGGVYGVRASAASKMQPNPGYRIDISFTCAPDRVDELVEAAMENIRNLQDEGPSEKNMQKVQETQRRSLETDLRENEYWIDKIDHYYSLGLDISEMSGYPGLVDGLNAEEVQTSAITYLNLQNFVKLVMMPEK